MAAERRNMPEQERSIKDREQELFFDPLDSATAQPLKPFAEYLRETPPVPTPSAVKVVLWILGILIGLLFFASLWRAQQHHAIPPPKAKAETHEPEAAAQAPFAPAPYPALSQDGTMETRRLSRVPAATPRVDG